MTELAYAAARTVAPAVYRHLEHHNREAGMRDVSVNALLPSEGAIARVIDAAFWASLRREEGYVPKISLAFLEPWQTAHPLLFERPLPLDPAILTKVAPAVERPGVHLGVSHAEERCMVWGVARALPRYSCVVEVAEPGLIVVKHHRGDGSAKYANVAVLEGDRVRLVDELATTLPDCPALLTSLLGFEAPGSWSGSMNLLVQLAVSMRAHRRGGLLLVVPPGDATWRESIVQPMLYAVEPPYSELSALGTAAALDGGDGRENLSRTVDAVAGLTAVDGATLLTGDFQLLAFGAKIARRLGSPQIDQVTLTEPIQGGVAAVVHPTRLGGTRHLSAAQFVFDQQGATALVASQDGRFTIFSWSPCEGMVHAHRVETLLL
jgi:hypothetical protein